MILRCFIKSYEWIKAFILFSGGRVCYRVFATDYYIKKFDKWIREE